MDDAMAAEIQAIRNELEPALERAVRAVEAADDPQTRRVAIETLHGVARQLRDLDELEERFRESLAENQALRWQLRQTQEDSWGDLSSDDGE